MTIAQALANLTRRGWTAAVTGDGVQFQAPVGDKSTTEATSALEVLRSQKQAVRQALLEVAQYTARHCIRGPRVWTDPDRLHFDFTTHGGRIDRATFLAAVVADGRTVLGPAGKVAYIGLPRDWSEEDGGTLRRRPSAKPASAEGGVASA